MPDPTKNINPIGIFDSGVGGLSVLREIRKQLPAESILYFADSGNCPYGSRSEGQVLNLARRKIKFLLDRECKLVVIACNTVTAVAIAALRADYPIPFIGMEPALKPAALRTRTGKIGVLATENTFKGSLFRQTCERHANGLDVFVQPGHGLVELVEQGEHHSPKARQLLTTYLVPMLEKGADTIVLGCTHYPFLKEMIQSIVQDRAAIIDPSDAVAAQTAKVLDQFGLAAPASHTPWFRFFTTGDQKIAERFFTLVMDHPFELESILA